ncbi:MAG TPA: DUF92 domain-containing protein [Ktedonobacteraceae bacterium]|jgi:uncharacterized protein (TIGR00297 family)|nr:DUF92 domain-containing protein [Ktedonobacteraceae bacterium]
MSGIAHRMSPRFIPWRVAEAYSSIHLRAPVTLARNTQISASGRGPKLLLGLVFSCIIALLARRRRSLTRGGAAGTVAVGTAIFGMGGWSWGLSLIYFFVSSTLFSHYREREKARAAADKFSKGSERDIGQVAANGGLATLLALAYGLSGSSSRAKLLQAGFTGALATANADTWATELGVLSRQDPRLITSGKRVSPGTSGGITLLGTTASALGAFSLGLVFWGLQRFPRSFASLPFVALLSGLAGSFFDSLLGATVQAMYYCPICGKETERRIHSCGVKTTPLRGVPWIDNDVVNFVATMFGAIVALSLAFFATRASVQHLEEGDHQGSHPAVPLPPLL